jgi:hypothetical protein
MVPRQHIPAQVHQQRGQRDRAEHALQLVGRIALGLVLQARRPVLDQGKKIHTLVVRQAKGVADALEHLVGNAHRAALLEPRVPGDTDSRERRDVLATQPLRAPPLRCGEPQVRGLDACPTTAQELGTLPVDGQARDFAGIATPRCRNRNRILFELLHRTPRAFRTSTGTATLYNGTPRLTITSTTTFAVNI